jgi:hypothetical protein
MTGPAEALDGVDDFDFVIAGLDMVGAFGRGGCII